MGQIAIRVQQQCCSSYFYNKLKQEEVVDRETQMATIQEDHKYFFQQEWFAQSKQLLFYPEKFIYIYYGYKEDQIQMERYWSKIDLNQEIKHGFVERKSGEVLQLKWKYLLRRGVPMDKIKSLILDIFKKTYEQNEVEYSQAINIVFKGQEPPVSFKYIPTFQDASIKNIEEMLSIQVLNSKGILALEKICWTLCKTFYQIEYNPMVIQVANIMLIFLSESETYCILHFMLEDSFNLLNEKNQSNDAEEQRALRWHFMMNKNQFERLGKSFYDTVSDKSQTFTTILSHFKKIGFKYNDFFNDMINNLFIGYLYFPTILKLFMMFMNEGIKIYLRMSYALCYMLKDEILANKDPSCMKNLIKNHALKFNKKQIQAMINKGFSLRLVKTKSSLSRYSIRNELESIWDYLPSYLKLIEPLQIFSTQMNGFSLNTLYQKTEYFQEYPTIFFIKTTKNDVFGFFSDQNLKSSSQLQYYGTDESFVFKIHPQEEFYPSSGSNESHLYSEPTYFTVGSSKEQNFGVAIQIDSELNKGMTQNCETYSSPALTSSGQNDFQIAELEVYCFSD